MTIFNASEKDEQKYRLVSNEIILKNENLILRFTTEQQLIYAQFNVYLGVAKEKKIFLATYVSTGFTNSRKPIGGIAVLHKKDDTTIDILPQDIYSLLHNTRLEVPTKAYKTINELPNKDEKLGLVKYVGTYTGWYCRNSFDWGGPVQASIQVFTLVIKINGAAEFTNGDNTYRGFFRYNEVSEAILGGFEFMTDIKSYRFNIYIEKHPTNSEYIYGIYAGLERGPQYPVGGRMRLKKLDIVNQASTQTQNIDGGIEKDLKLLFTGNHPKDFIEKLTLNEQNNSDGADADTSAYAGNYYVYTLSTKQGSIYQFPLSIDNKGKARFTLDDRVLLEGEVSANAKEVSIYFKGDKHLYLMFTPLGYSSKTNPPLRYAYGASSVLNQDDRPTARVFILLKNEELQFGNMTPARIEIGTTTFYNLDNETKGMLSCLTGRYNRFAILPAEAKDHTAFRQRWPEFTDTFFYAACYLAQQGDYIKATQNLYQAYLHGFIDVEKLNKVEGIFTDRTEKLPPSDNGAFDGEKLTFLEIKEAIKKRAEMRKQYQ
jgi:hypothetical protein